VRRTCSVALVSLLSITTSDCRSSGFDDGLVRGDREFQARRYPEAILAYRQAVAADPSSGIARLKLADAYLRRNNLTDAAKEYKNAAELLPDSVDAQLKWLGMLQLGQMYDLVREGTERILQRDAANMGARVLHARAAAGSGRIEQAVEELERAVREDPAHRDAYFLHLGSIQLRAGHSEQADQAFAAAAHAAPMSAIAGLVLGANDWAHGRRAAAEESFRKVLAHSPFDSVANQALAALLVGENRLAEAEPYLRAMAQSTPTVPVRLLLADYFIASKRREEARGVLALVAATPEGYVEANSRLAGMEYDAGQTADAHHTIDETLRRDRSSVRALLTKAGFLVRERKLDEALSIVTTAIALDPQSADGRALLQSIRAGKQDLKGTIRALTDSVNLDASAVAPRLDLARLQLADREWTLAIDLANEVLKIDPDNAAAQLLLIRAFAGKGELAEAEPRLRAFIGRRPDAAEASTVAGVLLIARHNGAGARRAFERALQRDLGAIEPLVRLTFLEWEAGAGADAVARVERRIAEGAADPALYRLAGRIFFEAGRTGPAVAALTKAIDLQPPDLEARVMLAHVDVARRELEAARSRLDEVLQRYPTSATALTFSGIVLERQGRTAEAEKRYEDALASGETPFVAANNLSWLDAIRDANLDVALQLAQTAARLAGDHPVVNDTLGWVYYKKGLASLAVAPLESSVRNAPRNPVYRYHLGLAYARQGLLERARASLREALALEPVFDGSDDASAVLARLEAAK
jgi:tetratricopeptide (TPR) repeat protein